MPKKLLILILFTIISFHSTVVLAGYYNYGTQDSCTDITSTPSGLESAERTIIDALEAYETMVDVSDYDITKDEANDIVSKIIEENAQLFYVDREYVLSYSKETDYVLSITFSLKYSGNELDMKMDDFESRINMILNEIDESENELGIIHLCHDYIVKNYSYDETLGSSDAYNMLLTGKGTCMAYTALYGYILRQYGIDSTVVKSKELNHIWNAVYLNGEYYNVDVTWDDPIGGSSLITSHRYLMKSDEYFNDNNHEGRSSTVNCTSALYDDYRWGDDGFDLEIDNAENMILILTVPILFLFVLTDIIAVIIYRYTLKSTKTYKSI